MTDETFCLFCGKVGGSVCDSQECQTLEAELDRNMRAHYRLAVFLGVKSALKDRCKCELDWTMNRLERWWYVLKLLVCVALRLKYRGKECWPECIQVGMWHNHHDGYGWDADWIRVGRGVFCGWWFDLHHDGDTFI